MNLQEVLAITVFFIVNPFLLKNINPFFSIPFELFFPKERKKARTRLAYNNINHINDYIGDQYIESKKNNDTVYYNDSIQITLNKKNKVKKVELFTDHYKVEGNFYVGLEKNNLDYENHKEANNQYIAYSENKTVKMTYTLSNNTITKITLA